MMMMKSANAFNQTISKTRDLEKNAFQINARQKNTDEEKNKNKYEK